MQKILPQELKTLADASPLPLYVVGGSVRDFLAERTSTKRDWDICSPLAAEEFAPLATAQGLHVVATYRNTGTVKIKGENAEYEYTCFRSDKYVRGRHVPVEIYFTEDITLDARRRDFTANAVYYDICVDRFVDPLQGVSAIQERRLTTVDNAKKVFGEDGLRLMRLARQAAQLGFVPDAECLLGAKENASLIADISPERIWTELLAILTAEQKYGVRGAPYRGLKILEEIGVLEHILPALAKGKGLAQRADFHKYDVLEHSLRAVKYIEPLTEDCTLRLAALLHDVGKPLCMLRDGNAYAHPEEGERLARELLLSLKAPKKVIEQVVWLTKWHMYDYDCKTSEKKLRRFLVANAEKIPSLMRIKQADFSACTDDLSKAPTCARWENLLAKMQAEKVPFSLKSLAVNGKDLLAEGIAPPHVALVLNSLLLHTAVLAKDNEKSLLLKLAKGIEHSL